MALQDKIKWKQYTWILFFFFCSHRTLTQQYGVQKLIDEFSSFGDKSHLHTEADKTNVFVAPYDK